MDRQVMKAQLAQLKKDLDKKQKKLKMKAQLAQLKKDLEKKQRKLKNCESLARSRNHVRQKILEQVQLNKETDSSSEPQQRQTRVKFGGREEFEVSRRIRRQPKGEMGCDGDSHDTCQQHGKSGTSQDATSDTGHHAMGDTCQNATSDTCQHAMSDTCQYEASDTCQIKTSDTCQNKTSDTCQHAVDDTCQNATCDTSQHATSDTCENVTSDICQLAMNDTCEHAASDGYQNKTSDTCPHTASDTCKHKTSDTSQHEMSNTCEHATNDTCEHAMSDARCDASDNISCVGRRVHVGEEHETMSSDVSAAKPSFVVSRVNATGHSPQHVDIESAQITDGVFGCNTSIIQVSDISPYERNTGVKNIVQQNVVNSSDIDIAPIMPITGAPTTGAIDVGREIKENCPGHQRALSNQNSYVEIGEAATKNIVSFKSVNVSDACTTHDVSTNKMCLRQTKTVSPVVAAPVVDIPNGTPSANVNKMYKELCESDQNNKHVADNNSLVARETPSTEACNADGRSLSAESQVCVSCEEKNQDEDISSQSQPLVILHVKETPSSCITPGVNSGDISTNACHTPSSVSSLQLRKVSKRKSKGCYGDLGIRRSSRLRSVAGDKIYSLESSESLTPQTQDSLVCSDSGAAPRGLLSDLSSPVLDSDPLRPLQSHVDTICGSKTCNIRQGQGRGRKLRKVTTSSHRYSTRHAVRHSPCTREPSQNTSDSSTQCGSQVRSLLPDIELVLSSPELSDVVYFSLPDGEFGGLKLQKAKQNTLHKTVATVEDGQSRRMAMRNTRHEGENGGTGQAASVKSDTSSEWHSRTGLRDPGLGLKSYDNQNVTGRVCGTTVSDDRVLSQADNSPIVFHSLKETNRSRSLHPSQDKSATRRINMRRKKSRGKHLSKMQTRSVVPAKTKPSEEQTSQTTTTDGHVIDDHVIDDVIPEQGKSSVSQDSSSTKPQHVDTPRSSVSACTKEQVCESSNYVPVPEQSVVSTQPLIDVHEDTTDTRPQTVVGGDVASGEATYPVCDVQHKTETLLPCGSCSTPGGEVVAPTGVDGTCPNSLVTSSQGNTDMANRTIDRSCAVLETKVPASASPVIPTLFSENCPLKLVHSVRVDTDEEIVCVDARNERTGDMVAYCTHCHVVLCRQGTDMVYRQMTLGHCSRGSTFQRVHLLTSKKAIAVVAVLISSCGVVHGELYKVTSREGVTMYPLEFNKLTDKSTPNVILSCLLADLDLCLATSTKVSTNLVRVALARRLDGDFVETRLETVSEALVSLCPVENLPGAVAGVSHTTVHVWNYMSGSLLVSAVLPLKIDSSPVVCSEDGLLFCSVVSCDTAGVCLVAVNPATLQTALINRATAPTPLQQHRSLQAAANCDVICTLSANNLVALWSVYSATCLGFRPAVDATRVCFSDAIKTLMLASKHTVDIYNF